MKTALVHDWLNQIGGAEDVLEKMVELFPDAPLYTSLYDRKRMPEKWQAWDIRTGFIDWLPFARRKQQLYLPLYPLNFEYIDLRGYDSCPQQQKRLLPWNIDRSGNSAHLLLPHPHPLCLALSPVC